MSFVIRTRPSVEDSIADLETPDLLNNLIAAYTTVDILLEDRTVDGLDSAYPFNVYCWSRRTLSLLNYAETMADEYLNRRGVPSTNKDWVRAYQEERSHLFLALGEETSESMLAPRWVLYKEALLAHRRYLMWLNPNVYEPKFGADVRESQTPLVLPVPESGLHIYACR